MGGHRALLFGLNYAGTACALQGCVNDVVAVAAYLGAEGVPCDVVTDAPVADAPDAPVADAPSSAAAAGATREGMLARLRALAAASWSEPLDSAFIHYSGHGTHVRDASGDEPDGEDECLVPSDYASAGYIEDDELAQIVASFNPATRVTWVIDACHSASMLDARYAWGAPGEAPTETASARASGRHVCLSGCADTQTSADAFDVLSDGKAGGALTDCMLLALRATPGLRDDAVALAAEVRRLLSERGFRQTASLASTHDLRGDGAFYRACDGTASGHVATVSCPP
jgi:hypothetical protein